MSEGDFYGHSGDWYQMRWAPRDGQTVELLRPGGAVTTGWWSSEKCWDTAGGERLSDEDVLGWRPRAR